MLSWELFCEISKNNFFIEHLRCLLLNAIQKITKIANCMELHKTHILMNAFSYSTIYLLLCYLDVPLFHSCSLNNKINGLFKRYHWIIHNHELSNFQEILNKNNSAWIKIAVRLYHWVSFVENPFSQNSFTYHIAYHKRIMKPLLP